MITGLYLLATSICTLRRLQLDRRAIRAQLEDADVDQFLATFRNAPRLAQRVSV